MVTHHRTSLHRAARPFLRRPIVAAGVSASAAALVLGTSLLAAPAAVAATAPVQVGLFGTQDPTYNGAFRQSLSLLAYSAAGTTPPAEAVTWLLGQQCADGGFQAFRPDPSAACQKSDPAAYSGEDTNSTGLAAAALRAIGRTAAADRALAWILAAQNPDGGFPYFVGGDSDANSTAVVLLGTNTDGRAPASVQRGGVSAADFLDSLQIGCDGAATDDDGGFAFQSYGPGTLTDNDAASAQATLARSGVGLPVPAGTVSSTVPRATCPSTASPTLSAAELGAGHLARLLDAFGGAVPLYDYATSARVPGSVSPGDTAWATLSLAAVGVGSAQMTAAIGVLGAQPLKTTALRGKATGASSTATALSDDAGQIALAALATSAAGGSATTVRSYVTRIGATMRVMPAATSPTPTSTSSATATASATPSPSVSDDGALAPTGTTPLTPGLAALGSLLLLLGAVALGSTRRRGAHA